MSNALVGTVLILGLIAVLVVGCMANGFESPDIWGVGKRIELQKQENRELEIQRDIQRDRFDYEVTRKYQHQEIIAGYIALIRGATASEKEGVINGAVSGLLFILLLIALVEWAHHRGFLHWW